MVASSKIAVVLIAWGLVLAGCGLRGPIQMPVDATAQQTTATADSGQGKPEGATAKPHKAFVLDGLLR